MRVCVFCASQSEIDGAYVAAASQLGTWIGSKGHTLVWGGCNVGLMDVVGRAVRLSGGRAVAVIPGFLLERGLAFADVDERVVTPDMAARKAVMRQKADCFVALPGGIGTWEEAFEVLALKKLGQLDRPLLFANLQGYFGPLLQQLERSVQEGFSPPDLAKIYGVAATAQETLAWLEDCARGTVSEDS